MPVPDSEIERILSTVQMNCAASGGCSVYVNNENLTLSCVMGDKEICWITQEEGRHMDTIRQKIRSAL